MTEIQPPEAPEKPKTKAQLTRERIRRATAFAYDIQRLRLACANRSRGVGEEAEGNEIQLDEDEKTFLGKTGSGLLAPEPGSFNQLKKELKGIPIYESWLKLQKGVGPAMAGVIVGSFDIERENNASQMWSFAGLAVVDGKAPRPVKGEELKYNSWLRSKLVKVLAEVFIKCNSPWKKVYDGRKHHRQHQFVPVCMGCAGGGKVTYEKKKKVKCLNCDGGKKTEQIPWGKSDSHRHADAKRYMIKMFLLALWKEWRTIEGLTVRPPYHEEKLGLFHSPAGNDLRATRASHRTSDTRSSDAAFDEEIAAELNSIEEAEDAA